MVDDDEDSRSALPREIRAWRRLRIVKRDETFSLIFSPRKQTYGVGVEVGGRSVGPRGRGRARWEGVRPHPHGQGVGPLVLILPPVFLYFPKSASVDFQDIPRNFCFLHTKQHHGSSAENSVSPG